MLLGLLLGNWVDLDHIYMRLVGKVGWFESACPQLGMNCSFQFYPFHSLEIAIVGLLIGILVFCDKKWIRFLGWLGIGTFLALFLDWIHFTTGIGI